MAHSCNATSVALNRNLIKLVVNVPAGDAGKNVLVEYSTSALGPWTGAALVDPGLCSPLPPSITLTAPQSTFFVTAAGTGFNHNTNYFFRVTDTSNAGDVVICGPYKTLDYPTFTCGTQANVTQSSADITAVNTGVGAGGGTAHVNNVAACNNDSFVIKYGTTPGGPYSFSSAAKLGSDGSLTFNLTGLGPNTQYCYVLQASQQQEGAGVYATSNECCFTTLATVGPPPPPGAGPNLSCRPVQNLTTHSADVSGTGDNIPTNRFLRIAYGVATGGPYNTFTAPAPGTASPAQLYSATITNLLPDELYYYVVQELDTDGITILAQSDQCQFRTRSYSTECQTVSFDETSITVQVCADYVGTDQTLDFIYGHTPGGPYPLNGGSVPGTDTKRQCALFTIPLAPCEIIYYRGSVTKVPAIYEIDWQYAHMNRLNGVNEKVELRIGPESDYPLNQTLVDTDVRADQGTWHVKTGTYPVPLNVNQLHMGFTGTGGSPNLGNYLDSCSIILRRVLPSPLLIGEQLINGSFETPIVAPGNRFGCQTLPNGGFRLFPEIITPGLAWQTSAPDNLIEMWDGPSDFDCAFGQPNLPISAHTGDQWAELSANFQSELFQVVNLAVATADSQECVASTFNLDCDPATDVACTSATLHARYCGLPENYSVQFQYTTSLGSPISDASPVTFVPVRSSVDIPVSAASTPLLPNTHYFYRLVARDKFQNIIGASETCDFTTLNCVEWCGGYHDPNTCILIDPGNGEDPYFNCNQGI